MAPRSGPPIGVLPRKTIAWSASTRPRIAGSARTCTIAVDAVMNAMLVQPTATPIGNAIPRFGAAASTSIATPNPPDAMITSCTATLRRRALNNAPISDPTAVTENRIVNVPMLPWNVRVTNRVSTTWKLKASVPTTAIITSGIQSSGTVRT